MVAATQARAIGLTINGVDYSQYLGKLDIGFDSYSQGTGLVLKKGSLTIANIRGGIAIDPRDNNDFATGNIVTITWNGSPHPIASVVRILAPPSVGAIVDSLPVVEGNLELEIPIGCELAYFTTKQADAEATGVTYGNPLNANVVIANLLKKAGIGVANIGTFTIPRQEIPFPYNKNGGGFVALAGEFAYSTHVNGSSYSPSILYCNKSNVIQEKLIKVGTNVTYPVTVTLGTNDREYVPQLDLDIAPGIINVSGIKRTIVDALAGYPFTSTYTESNEGIYTTKTTTYYKNDQTSRSAFPETLPPIRATGFQSFLTNCVNQYVALVTYTVYSGSIEITTTALVATSKNIIFDFFNNGKLSHQLSVSYASIGSFYNITITNRQLYSQGQRTLIPTQVLCVGYKYNSDGSVNVKETLTFKAPCVVNKPQRTRIANNGDMGAAIRREQTARLTNIQQEIWEKVGANIVYSELNYNAVGLDNPTIRDDDDFFSVVPGRKTSLNDRNTTAPGTTFAPDRYSETETILSKSLTFGSGTNVKEYNIQIPFAWTETQLEAIGLVEGNIINGRQYQYLIECEPGLLSSYDEPLIGVVVVEPSIKRYFLCDALSWVHTATEDYVGMAGIYMGSSTSVSIAPTSSPPGMIGVQESTGSIVVGGSSIQFIVTGVSY
jgi:hypothetical protein